MTSASSAVHTARVLSLAEAHALAVSVIGLDPEAVDLTAPESLSALVRRALSMRQACSPRELREATFQCLDGLGNAAPVDEPIDWRATLDDTIESLLSYGDLLELPADDDSTSRVVSLAPPTFVDIEGVLFLLGGLPDGVEATPADLLPSIEYRCHTRRLRPLDSADTKSRLQAMGWIALPSSLWLPPPHRTSASHLLEQADAALDKSSARGDVDGLIVLDPDTKTTYYPGRMTTPRSKSGRFVARREQWYGAALWSYVELADGAIKRLIDLPFAAKADGQRGCDVAWLLQMAIDSLRDNPQRFALRSSPPRGTVVVDFYSPVPSWARRRWDVLGEEVAKNRSLFAYRFPESEFEDVRRTLTDSLWLALR